MASRLHLVISLQGRQEGQCIIGVEELGRQYEGDKEDPYTISAVRNWTGCKLGKEHN